MAEQHPGKWVKWIAVRGTLRVCIDLLRAFLRRGSDPTPIQSVGPPGSTSLISVDIPTGEIGFTRYMAGRIRKELGNVPVQVEGPLTLSVGEGQANLHRVFWFCERNPAECTREVDAFLKAVVEPHREPKIPPRSASSCGPVVYGGGPGGFSPRRATTSIQVLCGRACGRTGARHTSHHASVEGERRCRAGRDCQRVVRTRRRQSRTELAAARTRGGASRIRTSRRSRHRPLSAEPAAVHRLLGPDRRSAGQIGRASC